MCYRLPALLASCATPKPRLALWGTSFRTINSVPKTGTTGPVIEGADTSLRTTHGWDDVTGLGTPNVPGLVDVLSNLP